MLVAARTPVHVGIVEWPGGQGVATVIIKRTFDLVARGPGGPSQDQDPLRLETVEAGLLVHPTDFAPTKSFCDVLLIGRAILDPTGPVRVVVEPMRKLVERGAELGARHTVGADGDPTDPALEGAWARPTFDFSQFQSAPPDQRIDPFTLPIDLVVDHEEARFATRLEGPSPEAVVLDQNGWNAPLPVVLRADQLMIDPDRRKAFVVWRGVVSVGADIDPLLVVEVAGPIRSQKPRDMLRWPRAEAIEPSVLRRLAGFARSARGRSKRGTVPLGGEGDDEVAESTLTLEVEPSAVIVPAEQGPLCPDDVAASTLDPQRLAATPTPAPRFGPPPPVVRGLVEPLPPTRISQVLSRQEVREAIEAHRLGALAARPAAADVEDVTAVPPDALEAPTTDEDPFVRTVSTGAPAELRRSGLPFASDRAASGPRTPRATLHGDAIVRDGNVPMAAPTSGALPFARTAARTRPLPEAPSAATTPSAAAATPAPAAPGLAPSSTATSGLPFRPLSEPSRVAVPPPRAQPGSLVRTGTMSFDIRELAAPLPAAVAPAPAAGAAPGAPPSPLQPFPGVLAGAAPAPPALVSAGASSTAPGLLGITLSSAAGSVAPATPASMGHLTPMPAAPGAAVVAPSAGESHPPPAHTSATPSLDAERVATIKAELWQDVEGRGRTLARYGLTELKWRLVERRFAADLSRRRPEEMAQIVARLRGALRRVPGVPPPSDA